MNKYNPKKTGPRYFNNKSELGTATGGGGRRGKDGGIVKKKKFSKYLNPDSGDGEEAIDIEDEIGDVDSAEVGLQILYSKFLNRKNLL